MVRLWRWLVVTCGVAGLVALPAIISAWPVHRSDELPGQLLSRILNSQRIAYSGYAESSGGLGLPVTRQFGSVADLFGGTTQLRVWWRGSTDWRVDQIEPVGETDTFTQSRGTWTWDYESNRATWTGPSTNVDVRLPAAADLLPTNLARRLLSQAHSGEVSRLGSRRIAGRTAPGLRLRPAEPASTVDHVDVWADQRTGLPLRVDVYGKGPGGSVLTTSFLDFSPRTPSASTLSFAPPRTARVDIQNQQDVAAAIDQFGDATPPDRLAGLDRNPRLPSFGAIGIYGDGVTEFAAVPLPDRITYSLVDQLKGVALSSPAGLSMSVGPLSLMLTTPDDLGGSWLLTGTVTLHTLTVAAGQLPSSLGLR
jgi:outer membrane lipoprotein-sorting protein